MRTATDPSRSRDAGVRVCLGTATSTPAEVFGPGPASVSAGSPADLILVDLRGPSTEPVHDPVSALVYAAPAELVHTTICDGRVLTHARRVEGVR